jgi:hypothetical protein
LPSTTIDAVGGEYFSAWAASASDCKSRGKVCETKETVTRPSAGSLELPHAIAYPVARGGSHPIQATRDGCFP